MVHEEGFCEWQKKSACELQLRLKSRFPYWAQIFLSYVGVCEYDCVRRCIDSAFLVFLWIWNSSCVVIKLSVIFRLFIKRKENIENYSFVRNLWCCKNIKKSDLNPRHSSALRWLKLFLSYTSWALLHVSGLVNKPNSFECRQMGVHEGFLRNQWIDKKKCAPHLVAVEIRNSLRKLMTDFLCS